MGRGMSAGGGGGGGAGGSVNVANSTDVWTYRHGAGNSEYSDSINTAMRTIEDAFPGFSQGVNTVDVVELSGRGKNTILGFWDSGTKQLGMNQNFTNPAKMNNAIDAAAKAGFHPPRGNKTGAEAVALHEAGHALTDYLARKTGMAGLHEFSAKIVKDAVKNTKTKGGSVKFASKISGYATKNYAECVAEAVTDWYCNGSRAKPQSKAIIGELKKYN